MSAPRHLNGRQAVRSRGRLVLIPLVLVATTALFAWLVAFDQIKALVSLSAVLGATTQQEAAASMERHGAVLSDVGEDESDVRIDAGQSASVAYPRYGDAIGVLEAPAAGIFAAVFQGDDYDILAQGVGHYFASALPGEGGKVVLNTHNNTFFSTLDQLVVGDEVVLNLRYGTYLYRVTETFVFDESDAAQLADRGRDELFLYTCYPLHYLGTTPQRYAVICSLVEGADVAWQ